MYHESNKSTKDFVHTPMVKMVMTYFDTNEKKHAHLIDMKDSEGRALIHRTLFWAASNGIEVTFRPV